jgi:hypothetical protein
MLGATALFIAVEVGIAMSTIKGTTQNNIVQKSPECELCPDIFTFHTKPSMIGAFHILADFVASAQAELYCAHFDEEPKVAKGVLKQRFNREWGHTAHRGGSCWIGGRSSLCC